MLSQMKLNDNFNFHLCHLLHLQIVSMKFLIQLQNNGGKVIKLLMISRCKSREKFSDILSVFASSSIITNCLRFKMHEKSKQTIKKLERNVNVNWIRINLRYGVNYSDSVNRNRFKTPQFEQLMNCCDVLQFPNARHFQKLSQRTLKWHWHWRRFCAALVRFRLSPRDKNESELAFDDDSDFSADSWPFYSKKGNGLKWYTIKGVYECFERFESRKVFLVVMHLLLRSVNWVELEDKGRILSRKI